MGDVVLLVAGIVVVVAGAEYFFDGLMGVSARIGAAPFVVTALISGFELENLAAGIAANAKDLPGAAAGTFLGGATFLALAVTGLAALIRPIDTNLPWKPLLTAGLSPAALVIVSIDGEISRLDGGILVAWFAVLMLILARTGRHIVSGQLEGPRSRPVFRIVGGLAALAVGGDLLGEGLGNVTARFGVSQTLLGNTAIAASVEAEEVGRVAIPARRGRSDVAIGNIVGTIVHFVALNAGVIALVKPLQLDGDTRSLHLPVAAVATLAVCGMLIVKRRFTRLVGGLLLAAYVAYVITAIAVAA